MSLVLMINAKQCFSLLILKNIFSVEVKNLIKEKIKMLLKFD